MKTVWQKMEAGNVTKMKRVVFVGMALLAVAVGAACGGEASFEERWAELGVDEAAFEFVGDFTPEQQAAIRLDLKTAQVVFAEQFEAVTSDFTVYILSADLYEERVVSALGDAYEPEATCGYVVREEALILAPWECPETASRGAFLAFEYFQILQQDAGGLAWRRQVGTARQVAWLDWLEGGSAAYASALVSDATGRISLDARRDGLRADWAALAQPFPERPSALADPEQEPAFVYGVGLLATDWLVEQAGAEAVLKFFSFGGHAGAFEAAFGMTLDEFRTAFEQHRLEVAPPSE